MSQVFLLVLLFLLINYSISISSENLETIFNQIIGSIPEPSQTPFCLNYTNYKMYFNNSRFFQPMTDGMIISKSEDSLEAKHILLTAASDIKLDIGKSFYYRDLLIEFNISTLNLQKSLQSGRYEVSTLTLDHMYISPSHDLASSHYFKQFFSDSTEILHSFKQILLAKVNKVIHSFYCFDELTAILAMMKTELTQYNFQQKTDLMIYQYITINSTTINLVPKPVYPTANILFNSQTNIKTTFIVDNLSAGSVREETYVFRYNIKYEINKGFSFDIINIDLLPHEIRDAFKQLFLTTFKEKEKEYFSIDEINHSICLNSFFNFKELIK